MRCSEGGRAGASLEVERALGAQRVADALHEGRRVQLGLPQRPLLRPRVNRCLLQKVYINGCRMQLANFRGQAWDRLALP